MKKSLFIIIGIVSLLILSNSIVLIAGDYSSVQRFPRLRQWFEQRKTSKEEKGVKCQEKNSKKFVFFGKDIPLPSDSGKQPQECLVKNITKMGNGSQPDWSWDGKLITYIDQVAGSYEIFLMNADGSNRRCITCGGNVLSEFKDKHKGKPTFWPSDSRYLLFSVENEYT